MALTTEQIAALDSLDGNNNKSEAVAYILAAPDFGLAEHCAADLGPKLGAAFAAVPESRKPPGMDSLVEAVVSSIAALDAAMPH